MYLFENTDKSNIGFFLNLLSIVELLNTLYSVFQIEYLWKVYFPYSR